jgi:hypothetical protein
METHFRFTYKVCCWCGLKYQPVDWLPWRRSQFCCEKCSEALAHLLGDREPGDPATGEIPTAQGSFALS